MTAFHMLLKFRNRDRPASHWVAMTESMSDVNTMAMACECRQRGACYFEIICGTAVIHEDKQMCNFDGDFGNVSYEEINGLLACHNSYEVLTFIDEHNRMR